MNFSFFLDFENVISNVKIVVNDTYLLLFHWSDYFINIVKTKMAEEKNRIDMIAHGLLI